MAGSGSGHCRRCRPGRASPLSAGCRTGGRRACRLLAVAGAVRHRRGRRPGACRARAWTRRSAVICAGCGARSARARSASFGPGSASRRPGSAGFSAIATSSASRRRKSAPAPRAPWCRRRRCCCEAIILACMAQRSCPAPTTAAPPWPLPAPSPPRQGDLPARRVSRDNVIGGDTGGLSVLAAVPVGAVEPVPVRFGNSTPVTL